MSKDVGYLLKQITDKIKISADAALKSRNLTYAQIKVLEYVSGSGGTVTQKSIEDYLGVSHPTVVGIVSRMEKNGHLVCFFSKEDKRNKIVSLTEQASHMSHELQGEISSMERKLLKGLSKAEIESLQKMLSIILKNIE